MNNGGFPHRSAKYAPIQKLFLLPYHRSRAFDFAPPETGYECILHNHLFSTHLFFIMPKLLPLLPLLCAVIRLSSKLQVRVETWICLLAVDLKDLWLNHGAASAPACSVGGWLYFLSCPLCCLQDILKGYQLIWLKHGRQIAFGCDSDPDLRMLFPCSNKHHQA